MARPAGLSASLRVTVISGGSSGTVFVAIASLLSRGPGLWQETRVGQGARAPPRPKVYPGCPSSA